MTKTVSPYRNDARSKKAQVEEMFDHIAPTYDFLNHLLSAGIDRRWRRKAVGSLAAIAPQAILDLATGTGDFAIEALRLKPRLVTACDISDRMMDIGRAKIKQHGLEGSIVFVRGDSEDLPFEDNKFDAMTVGFGVRNFEDLGRGLGEMQRVLRPGGRVAILEVARPQHFPMKQLFGIYFRLVLPLLGRLFSRDARAYTYLPESVAAFPQGNDFIAILKKAGFSKAAYQPLTFGICAFYTAEK